MHRCHHIRGGELVRGQSGRIHLEPEGGVGASEDVDVGDPRDPSQLVIQVFVDEAVEIGGIELALRGGHLIGQQDRGCALLHGDTGGGHLGGQLRHRQRHAVLHVHLVDGDVGRVVEVDRDDALALHVAGGGDVIRAWNAVDLLLQRVGDGLFGH